jgi:hypothetical protein
MGKHRRQTDATDAEYVIVAGIAAMHHGSIRQTDDLDVCPRRSRENLERLGAVLSTPARKSSTRSWLTSPPKRTSNGSSSTRSRMILPSVTLTAVWPAVG